MLFRSVVLVLCAVVTIECNRYFSEEGIGNTGPWARYGRHKRVTYQHSANPRIHYLNEEDYENRIAIRDSHE